MHKALSCIAAATFCLSFASSAHAQDYEGSSPSPSYSSSSSSSGGAGAGALGVLFGFGLSGVTTGYDGGPNGGAGSAGIKYLVMPNLGIRGNLTFGIASADNPANPGPNESGIDGSQSASSYGLGVGAEYYLATGVVRPYVGGALKFTSTSTESKSTEVFDPANPDDQVTTQNDANCENIHGATYCAGSQIGVAGILGFEFFPWPNLSLAAEYQIGYAANSRADQKTKVANVTVEEKVGSESTVGFTTLGLLTLAIYF